MIWRKFLFSATAEEMGTLINLRVAAGLSGPQINSSKQRFPAWDKEKGVSSIPEIEKGRETIWGFDEWRDAREGGGGRDMRAETLNGGFLLNCHVLYDLTSSRPSNWSKFSKNHIMNVVWFFF